MTQANSPDFSQKPLVSGHRISAVAALSGVPAPTLRIWEQRYQAFTPIKTNGSHRLYSEQDLLRATLIKQLRAQGHGISSIATLTASALKALLQQHQAAQALYAPEANTQPMVTGPVRLAVVGLALAGRIESKRFTLGFQDQPVRVSELFTDLQDALESGCASPPDLFLIKLDALLAHHQAPLLGLLAQQPNARLLLLYRHAPAPLVEALQAHGLVLRREPMADTELADMIATVLRPSALPRGPAQQPVPPRKHSDRTLAWVANIESQVLCECPRHVAELIAQLASFEQYSRDCLNKSPGDAALHAHLNWVSGTARALFEEALDRVAKHEGIDLSAPPA